jgi:hypothetical protein
MEVDTDHLLIAHCHENAKVKYERQVGLQPYKYKGMFYRAELMKCPSQLQARGSDSGRLLKMEAVEKKKRFSLSSASRKPHPLDHAAKLLPSSVRAFSRENVH